MNSITPRMSAWRGTPSRSALQQLSSLEKKIEDNSFTRKEVRSFFLLLPEGLQHAVKQSMELLSGDMNFLQAHSLIHIPSTKEDRQKSGIYKLYPEDFALEKSYQIFHRSLMNVLFHFRTKDEDFQHLIALQRHIEAEETNKCICEIFQKISPWTQSLVAGCILPYWDRYSKGSCYFKHADGYARWVVRFLRLAQPEGRDLVAEESPFRLAVQELMQYYTQTT